MKLKNKVAIITGASRGIGRATAILFAKEGAKVVVDYFVSDYEPQAKENAESVIKEISAFGGESIMISCDVRSEAQITKLVEDTLEHFGGIDILINNAAYVFDTSIEDRSDSMWQRTVDTNLKGVYLCSKIISKAMNNGGAIVNASSTNAINVPNVESLDYDASKAGILSLTTNFAKKLAPRKIRVNATVLGWANTEMNLQLSSDFLEEEKKKIYLNRFADLEEVAKLSLFLASSDSSYITGSKIIIDGGHD